MMDGPGLFDPSQMVSAGHWPGCKNFLLLSIQVLCFRRLNQGCVLDSESISSWIRLLQDGNLDAISPLWHRYGAALEKIARKHYRSALNAVFDEQDLAQSVFMALWRNAEAGRLEQVRDRNELWWLLLEITRRRAMARMTYNNAQKRKPGLAFSPARDDSSTFDPLSQLTNTRQLSPEVLTILNEEHERFMGLLKDDVLRTIAQLHLEDHAVDEIARQLDVSPRTITRKLKLIRDQWTRELDSTD